jgi:hypothetical protein
MKYFAVKSYTSLFDLYSYTTSTGGSGQITYTYDYANPTTFECKAVSLRPQSTLESYGDTYKDSEFILIETPLPRHLVFLKSRVGNIREKTDDGTGDKYWVTDSGSTLPRPPMIFDISGITPMIDHSGTQAGLQLFCQLAVANLSGTIANG